MIEKVGELKRKRGRPRKNLERTDVGEILLPPNEAQIEPKDNQIEVMITVPTGIGINGKLYLPGKYRMSPAEAEMVRFIQSKYEQNEMNLYRNNGKNLNLGELK